MMPKVNWRCVLARHAQHRLTRSRLISLGIELQRHRYGVWTFAAGQTPQIQRVWRGLGAF